MAAANNAIEKDQRLIGVTTHCLPLNASDTTKDDGEQAAESKDDEEQYPSGWTFWMVILNLAAVLILTNVDMNIVATAVPSITDQFHTVADVGWYASAFKLAQCASQFVYGKVYTLFSIKKTFLVANLVFLVGSVLCATAASSDMFIVGRAISGLGSAGLMAGGLVVLVYTTPLSKRPLWLGMMGLIEGMATLAGPLLGGAITQYAGWRWCFYINLPMAAFTILLSMFCIRKDTKSEEIAGLSLSEKLNRIDICSSLILAPSLVCLFLAFQWAGTKYSWSSGTIVGLLVTSAVLSCMFAYNQYRRGDNAALPLSILKRRSVLAGVIFMLGQNSAGATLEYYLPIYYQSVHGYTPAQSGYLMLSILVTATIAAVVNGIGVGACGYYAPFMIFASILMPAAAGIICTFALGTSLARLITYTALWGFGYGIGFSGPQLAVQTTLSKDDVPLGLAIMLFVQSFGPTVAYAIAQVIFLTQLSDRLSSILPGVSLADTDGLTQLVANAPADLMSSVVAGISQALTPVWYFVLAAALTSMVGSLPMQWHSVKTLTTT